MDRTTHIVKNENLETWLVRTHTNYDYFLKLIINIYTPFGGIIGCMDKK